MINRDELVQIGHFKKPHGIKGEITFSFTYATAGSKRYPQLTDVMAGSTRNPLFFICEIDGIFVPFCVEDYRFISDSTAYVQLKNIDSDQKARLLAHKEVFFPKDSINEEIENDSFSWNYFIGFTLIDEQLKKIGRIIDVDETTINTLFIVERENVIAGLTRNPLINEEILIPAVEEFIIQIDENKKELTVALPEGLVG